MKKYTSTFTLLVITVMLITGLSGCNKPAESEDSSSTEQSTIESTQSTESISEPAPEGKPTNLVGLDGKPIYTSEINTNITDPEIIKRLSDDTYYAEPIKPDAMVDSFLFFKPSTGISYNIHDNPDMFGDEDGYNHFIGAVPENSNEWRRVNVGDKICGLTLKTAEMGLVKSEKGSYTPTGRYYCEFDGEITLTGYLYVNSPAEYYDLPGGEMTLYFFDGAVPLIAGSALKNYPFEDLSFHDSSIFNHIDFIGNSELPELSLDETINDTDVDLSGISRGDVVKVKATISNLGCSVRNTPDSTQTFVNYWGHLADIEILSDVIENDIGGIK